MKRFLLSRLVPLLGRFCRPVPSGLVTSTGDRECPLTAYRSQFSVLFPTYTGLGNFILKTPMLRALRQVFPEVRLDLLAGGRWGAEFVLGETGWVNQVWVLSENATPLQALRFFWRLRRERYDVVFLPFDTSPTFLWWGSLVAGIPVRVAHTWERVDRELGLPDRMGWTRAVPTHPVPVVRGRHETDLNFDLLDALYPGVERSYDTVVSSADPVATLRRFGLEPRRYVVVQIGVANRGLTPRRWPTEHFRELVRALAGLGWSVVLPGDRFEEEDIHQFAASCGVPVVDLAGRTTVAEVAAVICEAAGLVCHDSGLLHISNAVGTPLVALFGPSDLPKVRPMAPTSRVLFKGLPCAPCMAGFRMTEEEAFHACPIRYQCMRDISVEEVLAAVRQVARSPTRSS